MSPLHAFAIVAASLLAGILIAAQGPIYARMASELGDNRLAAALIAFGVATGALTVALVLSGTSFPAFQELKRLPVWIWFGGLIGVYQVLVSMNAVPRLGVTLFIALVVLGNLAAGLIYDHFGMFGLDKKPATLDRGAGVGLILTGVWLIQRA